MPDFQISLATTTPNPIAQVIDMNAFPTGHAESVPSFSLPDRSPAYYWFSGLRHLHAFLGEMARNSRLSFDPPLFIIGQSVSNLSALLFPVSLARIYRI